MVTDLKAFAHKGCKIAAQEKFVLFGELCLTSRFFVLVLLSALVKRFFVSHMRDFQSMGPLGQCFLKVEMSTCLSMCVCVCLCVNF